MINISYKLNKKINTHIFFADENFNFLSNSSNILKKNINIINLYKEDFKNSENVLIEIVENRTKHQIFIFKIKSTLLDYDYQKLGGIVFDRVSKFEKVNLFLDSSELIKKNFNIFISNFFLGLFQKVIIFLILNIKKKIKIN
jgi:hypothetical protein